MLYEHFNDQLIISCNRYIYSITKPVPLRDIPFYLVFLKAILLSLWQYAGVKQNTSKRIKQSGIAHLPNYTSSNSNIGMQATNI